MEMVAQAITLQLPEPILRYFQQIATDTRRPVEQLVRQSVEGNLPPSVPAMPREMRSELLNMQALPVAELKRIALGQVAPAQRERHLALLAKNSVAEVAPAEQDELVVLRQSADRLMLRKAYAWAVLRWLGHPTPSLDELPLE